MQPCRFVVPRTGRKTWDDLKKKKNVRTRAKGAGAAKDAVGVAPLAVGRWGQGSCSLVYLAAGRKVLEDSCFGKR